jgi:hypothetical protein
MLDGRARILLLLGLTLLPAGLPGQQILTPAELSRLVEDLSSKEWGRRDEATRRLRAALPEAEPALRLRLEGEDLPLETRLRLQALLQEGGPGKLRGVPFEKGTRVSMAARDLDLARAVRELARLAGTEVRTAGSARGALARVTWEGTPFFRALDELCREHGQRWYRDARDGSIQVVPLRGTEPQDPPVLYAGALRLLLHQISTTRRLDFRGPPQAHLRASVQIDVEDRCDLAGIYQPVNGARAVTDGGAELVQEPAPQRTPWVQPCDKRRQFQVNLSLPPAPREASRLARLELPLRLVVADRVAALSFSGLRPGQGERRREDFDLVLEHYEPGERETIVRLSYVPPAAPAALAEALRGRAMAAIALLDAAGERLGPQRVARSSRGEREVWTLTLPAGTAVEEVQIEIPVSLRVVEKTYVFEALPLP